MKDIEEIINQHVNALIGEIRVHVESYHEMGGSVYAQAKVDGEALISELLQKSKGAQWPEVNKLLVVVRKRVGRI